MACDDPRTATRPAKPPRTSLGALGEWLSRTGSTVELKGGSDVEVTGITLSTQRVLPGDLYAALPGAHTHGADFVASATAAGAVAVLTDRNGGARLPVGTPALVIPEPRRVLGGLSAQVYGDPAARLRMIGVTGTQGKTTTTRLAESGLEGAGVRSAVIGTIGTRMAGLDVQSMLTTPEAPDLHGLFALMCEREVVACAMEVSSHALVLGRVDGVVFDVAVFTNLGRDHLDFHADIEHYYRAKAALFTPGRTRLALLNVDDEHGRRLAAEASVPVRTYAVTDTAADWRALDIQLAPSGSRFLVQGPAGIVVEAGCPMPGDFNVANALAAVAACAEAGFDAARVAAAIAAGRGVPGRLERIEAGQDFSVIVDYAHKPDAVAAVLHTLRPLTRGRVIIVLGAGGDRDPGKRPLMGELAARGADLVVVTDDNPRSEDPADIRAELLEGAAGVGEAVEIGDRRTAIRHALALATPGDVVLIAGKGHETGQEIAGVVHPFDDRAVAFEELGAR